jgi:DNA-binding MarR family transcriptional regulator
MPLKLIPGLHRATHSVGLAIANTRDLDVTQAEAHILAQLAPGEEVTLGALHAAFGHKRSTLTSILDRLVERGLVTRDVPDHDRRSVVVRATRAGTAVATRAYERLAGLEARITRRVSTEALAGYQEVIRAIELEAREPETTKKRKRRA